MSEPLHKDEFLLLLLDMGAGVENIHNKESPTAKLVDDIQNLFDIAVHTKGDIMYTLAESDVVGNEFLEERFRKFVYKDVEDNYEEWPFTDDE